MAVTSCACIVAVNIQSIQIIYQLNYQAKESQQFYNNNKQEQNKLAPNLYSFIRLKRSYN